MLQAISSVLLGLCAVPAVLSVGVYSLTPWWKSQWGRHVMSYMVVVAVILLLSSLSAVITPMHARTHHFDNMPTWFLVAYFAAYACLPVVLWWRFVLILGGWLAARREERP